MLPDMYFITLSFQKIIINILLYRVHILMRLSRCGAVHAVIRSFRSSFFSIRNDPFVVQEGREREEVKTREGMRYFCSLFLLLTFTNGLEERCLNLRPRLGKTEVGEVDKRPQVVENQS